MGGTAFWWSDQIATLPQFSSMSGRGPKGDAACVMALSSQP